MISLPKCPPFMHADEADIEPVQPVEAPKRTRIRREDIPNAPESNVPASLGEWAKKNKPKAPPKQRGIPTASMNKALVDADARRAAADDDDEAWKNAKPLVLVALYVRCYEFVYGISPSDLGTKERSFAAFAAGRMLKNEFDGHSDVMVDFIRWAWKREDAREKWRRAPENKSESGFRITWRLMFSGTLLDDWRVARLRGQA